MSLNDLNEKISDGSAVIGILGLGYVGLPLAVAFSDKFKVIGYDSDSAKIEKLSTGDSYLQNYYTQKINREAFSPTSDPNDLQKCDFLIICVPTPLTINREPDLSYIMDASNLISKNLKKDQFVILESTTFPGTTEEVVLPILNSSGLKPGSDFGLAYSPERIDPGNKKFTVQNTPKVVGGINELCGDIATKLYESVVSEVIKVSSCRAAEATKIVENIFRNVNIALVNELALIFERMNIDVWEVTKAASSKPFGFMPFYPGPGVGGHCIPVDPFYLSYQAKKFDIIPRFIEMSGEINEFMKIHAVNLVRRGLEAVDKDISSSKIAVMGLSYKRNVADTRESPSIKIIEELIGLGAEVDVFDPFIKEVETKAGTFTSLESIEEALKGKDCAIFVVDHDAFKNLDKNKFDSMNKKVIVDCKNIFDGEGDYVYYCIGKPPTEDSK